MKRLYGTLRVLGLALAMLGLVTCVTLRRAQAKLIESLSGFGDQIAKLQDLSADSAPRQLMINGLELRVMTLSTRLDVKAALDRFQSVCHAVGQIDLPATVRQTLQAGAAPFASESLGVMRLDAESEGFLACIDLGEGLNAEGFLERLQAFGESKDLRSLGEFRYGLAKRHGDTTTLVLFWTEGAAKLTEMFRERGDAPGRDVWGMPRPENATRVLSAFEYGKPYGIAHYRVAGQAEERALSSYEGVLHRNGWSTSRIDSGGVLARKAERSVVVTASRSKDGQVTIGISDLG